MELTNPSGLYFERSKPKCDGFLFLIAGYGASREGAHKCMPADAFDLLMRIKKYLKENGLIDSLDLPAGEAEGKT